MQLLFSFILQQKEKTMRKLSMDELNRLSKDDFEQADKLPIIIVLDNIRSLSNVGAFFRTAVVFVRHHSLSATSRNPQDRLGSRRDREMALFRHHRSSLPAAQG